MTWIQQPSSPSMPVIGLFAPIAPDLDVLGRERTRLLVAATAKILKRIVLPGIVAARRPGVWTAETLVATTEEATAVATDFAAKGVRIVLIVTDGGFAVDTARTVAEGFPLLGIVAGSSARRGGAHVDALAAAFAGAGRLVHVVGGNLPEAAQEPDFDEPAKAAITDLAWALAAVAWLPGRRVLTLGDTSGTPAFGLETVVEQPDAFAMRMAGEDSGAHVRWLVDEIFAGRIHPTGAAAPALRAALFSAASSARPADAERVLAAAVKPYLVLRRRLQEADAIAAWWPEAPPLVEALAASLLGPAGAQSALPLVTADDAPGVATALAFAALCASPVVAATRRIAYSAADLQRKADELGLRLDPNHAAALRGALHLSATPALAWCEEPHLFLDDEAATPGFIAEGGIDVLAGRLVRAPDGTLTMFHAQAATVALPAPLAEALAHAGGYASAHVWLTPVATSASALGASFPAPVIRLARGLPLRRWQFFSDHANVRNHRWDGAPAGPDERGEALLHRFDGSIKL